MIRLRYSLVSLLLFVTLPCAAEEVDKGKLPPPHATGLNLQAEGEKRERLRKAACLPQLSVEVAYGVNGGGEFENLAELMPDPEKIAELERKLKGDATDAERYCHLAILYNFRAYQPAKGKEARLKAAELFRKQLEQHPDDIALQLRLAEVLDDIEKTDEAEASVRRLVKDQPNNWHAWLALGKILDGKCRKAIVGQQPFSVNGPEAILRSMRAAQPTPEKTAAAQKYRREAVSCLDRAVSLAPGEAEVYRRRGASGYVYGLYDFGLRSYKGEKVDFFDCLLGRAAGRDTLPDFRRAVQLDRREYQGIGFVAFLEATKEVRDRLLRNPSAKLPKKMVDILAQPSRKYILDDMACLEKGAQDADKNKAAEAAEVLGYLQFFLFADCSAAEKSARRSIELDRKRETAWDILSMCQMRGENYRELAAVCRERLVHKDSARNRLMLAKAYEHLKELDKAEEVVRAGLQLEPSDFMLRLAVADLLLMRGNHESLHEAGELLRKLHEEKLTPGGWENRWANYAFALGIYCGLIDRPEQAREWLKAVQKRKPDYAGVEDALKALQE